MAKQHKGPFSMSKSLDWAWWLGCAGWLRDDALGRLGSESNKIYKGSVSRLGRWSPWPLLSLLSPLPSIPSNQGGTTLSSLEPPKVAGEQWACVETILVDNWSQKNNEVKIYQDILWVKLQVTPHEYKENLQMNSIVDFTMNNWPTEWQATKHLEAPQCFDMLACLRPSIHKCVHQNRSRSCSVLIILFDFRLL